MVGKYKGKMNKSKLYDLLAVIARAIIGIVFIFAAVGKIHEPMAFLVEIHNYDMLPGFIERIAALWLPWIELLAGIMLLVGYRLKANAALIGIMLTIFTIGVAMAWGRGLDINCGCFGDAVQQKVGLAKILENTAMILGSLFLFWRGDRK